jgi:3-oxoacyl-[acyl-carrier protein] reductase
MTQSLKGRSVLVTGGSKGIGKGIARVFAKRVPRSPSCRAMPIRRKPPRRKSATAHFGIGGDVTSLASMESVMKAVAEKNGGLDVLCANAGIFPPAKLEEMTGDQWDEVVDTNLKGTFHSVKAAIPYLKNSDQGRIVITSSITGPVTGFPAGRITERPRPANSASCAPPASSLRNTASPSTP